MSDTKLQAVRTPEMLLILAFLDAMPEALGRKTCRVWNEGAMRALEPNASVVSIRESVVLADVLRRHCRACGKCKLARVRAV